MALLRRAHWWIVPAYLFGAAVYQLTLVVEGRTDNKTVAFVTMLAMLVGAGVALVSIPIGRRVWAVVSLAPAAAGFVVLRFYTYDPYYSPTLRRYSDAGAIGPAWVWVVAAAALVAGVVAWRVPRTGAVATAIVVVTLAGTTALMGTH
jgi:hypothetical protein